LVKSSLWLRNDKGKNELEDEKNLGVEEKTSSTLLC